MDEQSISIEYPSDGIVRITLNRPKALNALNVRLLTGLVQALRSHQDSRVLIIEGAGDRSFCAGEDLKQTLAPITGAATELRKAFLMLQDITRLTSSSGIVVVSAVQGFAIGGGAEIALAADFVIGGPGAKFKFPEVTLGHAVTGGISLRLVPIVGLLKAKELLLTGRWVDAEEALRLGMLNEICDDPKQRALELALELGKLPAIAMSSSKTSLERATFVHMEACLQDEVNVASYCFNQGAANEAFAKFAARKGPVPGGSATHITFFDESVSQSSPIPTFGEPKSRLSHGVVRDINTALRHAAERAADKTFLRFDGKDESYGECYKKVLSLAEGLHHAGITSQDRVIVMMRNSMEMVHTWLATNFLGAVWVPINVEFRSITLKHVVEASQPKLAVVDAEFLDVFRSTSVLGDESIFINNHSKDAPDRSFGRLMRFEGHSANPFEVTPSTTAAFLYTSGTTGKSKPCELSHEYFILQARTLIEGCGLRNDDVLFCPFPLFHADATALTVIPALLLGAVAALSVRFSASRFWDEVRDAGATIYDFMGATLAMTYKQSPNSRDREHKVRLAWGVPVPHFAKEYEKRFGHPLITLYGSVEASLPIFQSGALPSGSCGRLREKHHIRIADDSDEELPPNTPGHLLLRTDVPNAFFKGYFNDPINTAAAFRGLWLHTGDLAKVDESGNVYFMGRVKDVIRRRGENVNACEVEEEFLQHPDVVIAAAYGIPSRLGAGTEEDIKVAVRLKPNSNTDEMALWEWSTHHMARFQVPSVIEIVPHIRKTPTGKMEKFGLAVEGGRRFDIRK